MNDNIDPSTVNGFGAEWSRFPQIENDTELDRVFDQYFGVFPWSDLPKNAVGFDLGCGSGRWAKRVAPRVGHLHCIDASADALAVAKAMLATQSNVSFHCAGVSQIPLPKGSTPRRVRVDRAIRPCDLLVRRGRARTIPERAA